MKVLLWVVLLLAACTEHGQGGAVFCRFMGTTHVPGDAFPAGDGCNVCECTTDGAVTCTEQACSDGGIVIDSDPSQCTGAPGSGCAGPLCNGTCCAQGEACLDQTVCSCGGGPSCTNGDVCATAGPMGEDARRHVLRRQQSLPTLRTI